MSRVDKFQPQKSSAITKKTDALKSDSSAKGSVIREITFDAVKEDAIKYGLVTDVDYQMSSGKEASIFLALWKGYPIVLKVFRLYQSSHQLSKKKGYSTAASSKRTYNILGMMEDIAMAEYDILMNCFKAGVHSPTPIGRVGHMLTMRFIGDDTTPAPQLKDVELENPEVVLDQILDDYLVMYRDAHYVHGDLSRYNILWWKDRPWIIDVPQAYEVGPWSDMPKVEAFLRRDIKNVLKYFESYGIHRDAEVILEIFLSEYTPKNLRHYRELMREGGELV
ncbi:MAG: RIO1 family regulatory kinase/ATPase [Candidatus Thorarchaeota archaeon]